MRRAEAILNKVRCAEMDGVCGFGLRGLTTGAKGIQQCSVSLQTKKDKKYYIFINTL